MEIDYNKAEKILKATTYVSYNLQTRTYFVHPVLQVMSENDEVGVLWDIGNGQKRFLTLQNLSANYTLDNSNCTFYPNNSIAAYSSIAFNTVFDIEISEMFKHSSDIVNMLKEYRQEIVFEYSFDNFMLMMPHPLQKFDSSQVSFNDLEYPDEKPVVIDFVEIVKRQKSIKNNTIYTVDGGYFKFHKLVPVSFKEAIVER
jgi:hypothetical protein